METSSKLQFVSDALRQYTEDFTLLSPENPFLVVLNGEEFSIHVSPIHDSGNNRPNDDEERIQIETATKDIQEERRKSGAVPIFIGLFPEGSVFSAWEPDYVFALEAEVRGTVYARRSHRALVDDQGSYLREFNSTKLGRRSRLISLRSSFLGFYLENWRVLHDVTTNEELWAIVSATEAATELPIANQAIIADVAVAGDRLKVTVTRTAYPRDPKFSRDVLSAYGHACAVCDRQLGLVQAAHIIPHNQDDSPNDVTNGIALCAEHHKLYDDALLLPAPNRSLHLNPARVEHLQNIGQGEGLAGVASLARKQFRIPNDPAHHPNAEYLRRGVSIRLGLGD